MASLRLAHLMKPTVLTLAIAALWLGGPATALATSSRSARDRVARTPSAINPCRLVTPKQASSFAGRRLRWHREAPLGPTCIYSFRGTSKIVTTTIEPLRVDDAIEGMHVSRTFRIRDRHSYCGTLGRRLLIASLPGHKVLKVAATCRTAERFAAQAIKSLRIG